MKNKYYIALQLMGINNEILINIIKSLSYDELKSLFRGKHFEIEFKYNIRFGKYIDKFNNSIYLNNILKESENVINKNKELGIKTILYTNKFYPQRLRDINNPPAIIYIKGRNILKQDEKSIACIGTRNPTNYGINAIKSIVTNLTKERFTIISGLADGVDGISHMTCLKNNGRTIAVLAHGLDIIYPKKHESLANNILESGGTLLTEYPVGTNIEKFRFVQRNRIVSALSKGVLMIEAKEKSGTRHTINFAEEQNKPIFCPAFGNYSVYSGLNLKLLKNNKAIAIGGTDEYIKIIYNLGYKLKYDKKAINNLKSKEINVLINNYLKNCNININMLRENNGKIGFDINKEMYEKLKRILKEKDITVKEFFNSVIFEVVNSIEED